MQTGLRHGPFSDFFPHADYPGFDPFRPIDADLREEHQELARRRVEMKPRSMLLELVAPQVSPGYLSGWTIKDYVTGYVTGY